MKTVLSVAGSDPSGGAGLQADLKTFAAFGVYGMAAITSVIAQNTIRVSASQPIGTRMIRAQLESVFEDIYPDAVKIGLIPNRSSARAIGKALRRHSPRFVVLDPVAVASTGTRLARNSALRGIIRDLLPLTTLVTPNLPEASALTGLEVRTRAQMEQAAKALVSLGARAALVKGGHFKSRDNPDSDCDDFLLAEGHGSWLSARRVNTANTHGTGCTLSSAIAACLALGMTIEESVRQGKAFVTAALSTGLNLGRGSGPLNHGAWHPTDFPVNRYRPI